MKKTNLYLPITSQPREFDAKLLLALFASERGLHPVLGYKSAFLSRLGRLPPGFFLAHNARQNSEHLRQLRKFGHRILVLDEEALVRQSDEIFLKKHPKDAFDFVNQVFAWGQDDYRLWQRSGIDLDGNLFITGNPRVDTMRPELRPFHAGDVAQIRARYGDYVLLNTNFPTVNNLTTQGGGMRLAKWARDARGQQVERDFLGNKRAMFETVLEIARPLAEAIAPLTLVIRPHPNEDHEPWSRAMSGVANAQVVFEGNVVPWIIGARALIHNNCTTAVEAAVVGIPILNFRPWRSEYDNDLAHAFGRDCADVDALSSAVRNIMEGVDAGPSREQETRLERHIANVTGKFGCERIVDILAASARPAHDHLSAGWIERATIGFRQRRLWLGNVVEWYSTSRGRKKRNFLHEKYPLLKIHRLDAAQLAYSRQQLDLLMRQFPPLTTGNLDERIGRYVHALNRFHGLRSVKLAENLFTIG